MVNFLFELIEFFSLSITVPELCVQFGCFLRGSTSLHTNFTWTGSSPINHSWEN